MADPPSERHLVQVVLHLPDGPLHAAATVARALPSRGVGLDLFALSAESKRRWDAFVALAQQQGSMPSSLPTPSSNAPPNPVSQRPAFLVRLLSTERLREYFRNHVAVGGTVLFTPVLPPGGSLIDLIVVHPHTQAEYALAARIQRVVTTAPKHLELIFLDVNLERFARYIEEGVASETVAHVSPSMSMIEPERAVERDVELELDFELDIDEADVVMGEEPVQWERRYDPSQTSSVPSGGVENVATSYEGDDDELLIDDTIAVVDPGLRPQMLQVSCAHGGCATEPYAVELGPCGGALGLVADHVPFWSPASARIISVPRLVPPEARRSRFAAYIAKGGSLGDVVTLASLLAAADLAEAPRHPVTAEPLKSSRAIVRVAFAVARHAVAGVPATTKVRCVACGGQLMIARAPDSASSVLSP